MTKRQKKNVVLKPVAYLVHYDNEKEIPTPLYTFYEKGKKTEESLDLRAALRRYPEDRYRWIQR